MNSKVAFTRIVVIAIGKVVWLANHSINFNDVLGKGDILYPEDVVKHKALHGSRLYEVVRLLPEFGGALPKRKFAF